VKKIIVLVLALLVNTLVAQTNDNQEIEFRMTVPEIALVSVAPENSAILLAMEKTEIAGEKIVYTSNQDHQLWLNYTCSIAPDSPSKNISVQIVSGSVPTGIDLQLSVSEYSGSGKGEFGTPTDKISVQNYPQNIISNIGGSFTNKGINNGHKLEYSLGITNYKLLDAESSNTLTIVFTISDN
jgi:hypothetical protein